jgi:ribosomal protein L15E
MDFMQARLAPQIFLSSARGVDQQTEAHAYVGFMLLQAGRQADALEHLRWVKEHGTKTFYEYRLATSELERLERPPEVQRLDTGVVSPSRLPPK